MMSEATQIVVESGVARVTLNRPDQLNALNMKLKSKLVEIFSQLSLDDSVRAVVITGAGRAFCAGSDIKERLQGSLDALTFHQSQKKSHELFNLIERFEKPVLAAVNGVATGGGLELALAADIRLASDDARFGLAEVKIGAMPAGGGTQRLPRLIGVARAKELMFTGDSIDANRALEYGLVNRVVPIESLIRETVSLAQRIANRAPVSVRMIKQAVNIGLQMDLESALAYELSLASLVIGSEDLKEGFQAFVDKRKPEFKGR